MRVFVASRRGQGDREGDFFWGVEGELVRMPFARCSNPRCGCDRSVAGLASSKASTTFMSTERSGLDATSYRRVFVDALRREGWISGDTDEITDEDTDDFIAWHIRAAAHYPADTVLRVRVGLDGRSHVESPAGCSCGREHS